MKTAVVYARYSSERQNEQSIEGQLRVCKDYAKRNDIQIIGTYIDRAMTGTNANRAQFQKMLKDGSKKLWDIVLVYKLDRFSRNKYEMAIHKKTLRDNGIKLVSAMENIPDTPEGIILESLLEGMAEYYSAELSQKLKRGMREGRIKGLYAGGHLLFGYKVKNKKVYVDENNAKIVQEIYEKYAAGVYIKDIIADLHSRGIYNRNKPFARATVYSMLKNEKYAGIVRYKDEVYTNIYPKIVSDEVFTFVRKKMIANHYGRHPEGIHYLLRGKVFCGYCNHIVTSDAGTSRNKKIARYYKCSHKKIGNICECKTVRKEILEKIVIDTTFKIFENKEIINKIADSIEKRFSQDYQTHNTLNILLKEKSDLEQSLNNFMNFIEKGITIPSLDVKILELDKKLKELNNKIIIEESRKEERPSKENFIKFIRTTLKRTPSMLIDLLVKKVILYNDKVEIYYNYTWPTNKNPDLTNDQDFLLYSSEFYNTFNIRKKFFGNDVSMTYKIKISI